MPWEDPPQRWQSRSWVGQTTLVQEQSCCLPLCGRGNILFKQTGKTVLLQSFSCEPLLMKRLQAEARTILVPTRALDRFARVVQAHGNYRHITRCSEHRANPQPCESTWFQEGKPHENDFEGVFQAWGGVHGLLWLIACLQLCWTKPGLTLWYEICLPKRSIQLIWPN